MLFFKRNGALIQTGQDGDAPIDSQRTAVQSNVVVLRVSPFHICVEAVICGAAFILVAETLLRRVVAFPVFLHNTFGAEFEVGVDEGAQKIGSIPENIIGAPADDHARSLFRKIHNDLVLKLPQIIGVVPAVAAP